MVDHGLYSQVVFQSQPEVDSIGNGKERNYDDVENDEDDYDNNNNDDEGVGFNIPHSVKAFVFVERIQHDVGECCTSQL